MPSLSNRGPGKRTAAPQPRGSTFFGGAAILALGIMVVKVIGMFYKIPLINIIGEQGSADFNNAYNIYSVLLTISTAGLPVAVSKLVSEANALGRHNQVKKVFRLSLTVFLSLGVISFLVMFFRADLLAEMMNDPLAAPGIKALAPAVICVGCLSAFRGYSQGHSNMAPTAVSQILEAVTKLFLGLALAAIIMGTVFTSADLALHRPELDLGALTGQQTADAIAATQTSLAAAGAITGVTVGTILALAYMILSFLFKRMRQPIVGTDRPEGTGAILSTLMKIAIPITLSSAMVGIVTVIDTSLVQGQMQDALGLSVDASRTLYGNYAGALNLYNLPLSLMAAITASVIPAVSAARAKRDRRGASKIVGSALRFTALISFPMGVGLMVLGTPIIALIFPTLNREIAGPLLSTLGLAAIFVCLMLVCNSVLQAHGIITIPVIIMVLGGILKIVTNYNLVARPEIGIYGAPVGNVLCFGLCLVLDLIVISRVIPDRPRYRTVFLKPALAAGVMGVAAWAVYGLCEKVLLGMESFVVQGALSRSGNVIACLLAIGVAGLVYLSLIIFTRAISRDDLSLMPKGDKIAKLLRL